jgi:insertion element IS1 protein InsB
MWGSKHNDIWVFPAQDRHWRLIIGCAIGKRDSQMADELWRDRPPAYRPRAVSYTDELPAYRAVLPSKRHRPSKQGSGQTHPLERLKATLRARCARWVRKTRSFSQFLRNHHLLVATT